MANYEADFSASLKDYNGVRTSSMFHAIIPDSVTIAQLKAYNDVWLGNLDPVTGSEIVRSNVKFALPFSGLKSTPVANSRNEQTGLFNFYDTAALNRYGVDIPAILDSLVLHPGDLIDTSASVITNLIGFLTSAGANGETPDSGFGNTLVALADAILTFRKRRKQLLRAH